MTRNKYLSLSLLLWLLLPLEVVAGTSVWFLYDKSNAHHQQYVDKSELLLKALPDITLRRRGIAEEIAADGDGLLITVGTAAAQKGAKYNMVTVNTLITRRTFNSLNNAYRSPQSAIFLEQPVARQLQLIKSALPSRNKLTVLVGSESAEYHRELQGESQRQGLELELLNVDEDADIDRIFSRNLLSENTLLLLPDPQVVNRRTVKPLVLGSYRKGIPVVGYSQALVKAGALMAVHSPISALERQMLKSVKNFFATGVLPPPRYASDFEVSVNYQLARALKISLPSEKSLKQTLEEQQR